MDGTQRLLTSDTNVELITIMFKKDIELIKCLHERYNFKAPLLDVGGLEEPTIADYEISINKAIHIELDDGKGLKFHATIPHPVQNDRYIRIPRPFSFIDPSYVILNPEYGDPYIEDLPKIEDFPKFNTIIMVSVFEHVSNPYVVSNALFEILKPGGYLINSTPFLFPYHPSPEDNFRYSPIALKRIHESSGFKWIEGDFHINYSSKLGIGDTNPQNYGAPQAVIACYALCQKV